MDIFTKTQFTEWAEPIPASEVHPPCSRGAIVREPPDGDEERGTRRRRMVSGMYDDVCVCMCLSCTAHKREEKWAFPSESSNRSYALPLRMY